MRTVTLAGLAAFAWVWLAATVAAADLSPYRATDGDTIRLGDERIRVVGMDAPETFFARCPIEKLWGRVAAAMLQAYLDRGPVRIERLPRKDRYGRTLARVFIDGEDIAGLMIRDGLAVAYDGATKRIDWCAYLCPPAQP